MPGGGGTEVDSAAAGLAQLGNLGVSGDQAASLAGEADRRAHALDAAQKFPANEAESSQQFQQLAQMIPQMASGIAGAITGALGGIMQPLTQVPQQAMQAAESAIQPLMGAAKGGGAAEAALTGMSGDQAVLDNATQGGGGSGGGIGGGGGTTPTGFMGPPPVPSSSPPTTPAGASAKPVTVTQTGGTPTQSGPMGMTGMPMMPGAMGARGEGGSKDKPAEKRLTVPGIPNGQPVKGRLTAPPSVPVAKSEGKPPVVTRPNRRIVIVPTDEEAQQD
ncbi:hypothetical protein [Mycobacterium terramassiliense]|uniref:Uncharacterized protein n=1 Tax=Mycobacterium terramassiliense TaxID=1841859 RepID=A0A2U3NE69_9MYCO|nr:hypothetical protein [Mycobacterium terramassiliense]SPM29831.1 hypothetical protein MTAB308_3326 [Mycobacterium terramassiliense]